MGLHTGEPQVGEERYVGLGVHKAARIGAAGHGGQVLLSRTTRELVEDELPPGVTIRDLGERRLKDVDRPERLSQLVIEGLPSEFGRAEHARRRAPAQAAAHVRGRGADRRARRRRRHPRLRPRAGLGGRHGRGAQLRSDHRSRVEQRWSGRIRSASARRRSPSAKGSSGSETSTTGRCRSIDPATRTGAADLRAPRPRPREWRPERARSGSRTGSSARSLASIPASNDVVETIDVSNRSSAGSAAYGRRGGLVCLRGRRDRQGRSVDERVPGAHRRRGKQPLVRRRRCGLGLGGERRGQHRLQGQSENGQRGEGLHCRRAPALGRLRRRRVWVANEADDNVTRLDATSSSESTHRRGNGPDGHRLRRGAVWVANSGDGTVSRIDPRRTTWSKTITVGNRPYADRVRRRRRLGDDPGADRGVATSGRPRRGRGRVEDDAAGAGGDERERPVVGERDRRCRVLRDVDVELAVRLVALGPVGSREACSSSRLYFGESKYEKFPKSGAFAIVRPSNM